MTLASDPPGMTLTHPSSHVIRRIVVPPEVPDFRGIWTLLLPVLLMAFQLIPFILPPLGVRPTMAAVLASAMAADLLAVGVAVGVVARHPGNLGFRMPYHKSDLLLLPVVGASLSLVAVSLADLVYSLFTGNDQPPPQGVARALAQSSGTGLRILAVLTVGFVAPLAEEIVFRGVTYRGLRRRLGFIPAAALSAFLFSLAHVDLQHALQLFAIGVVLAWTTERSGSILPGMVLHAGVNLLSLLVLWDAASG